MAIFYMDPKLEISVHLTELIKKLLSDKHLYQSATLDLSFLDRMAESKYAREEDRWMAPSINSGSTFAKAGEGGVAKHRAELDKYLDLPWSLTCQDAGHASKADTSASICVKLPTINTVCSNRACGGKWPYNALDPVARLHSDGSQSFYLLFQCQNCKGTPVSFLVKRVREKLILCGRDPIEEPSIASHLPKDKSISKHFRNAIIAFNAGQPLAGICLLRVFVEQFWRSIPEVSQVVDAKPRATGEELGDAYKSTLPDDFKGRFPTLLETYGSLSRAIHGADDDGTVFEKNRDLIIKHFEARRLFDLA